MTIFYLLNRLCDIFCGFLLGTSSSSALKSESSHNLLISRSFSTCIVVLSIVESSWSDTPDNFVDSVTKL